MSDEEVGEKLRLEALESAKIWLDYGRSLQVEALSASWKRFMGFFRMFFGGS